MGKNNENSGWAEPPGNSLSQLAGGHIVSHHSKIKTHVVCMM